MNTIVSVTEVARNFADYLNRVAFGGERFVLTRARRPVARLEPAPSGRRLGELPALIASLPRLEPDDADAFAADVAQARRELGGPPGGAWPA